MYSQSELDEVAWEGADHDYPTIEEYRKNGLYCKSGLAFPVEGLPDHGKCAIIDHVEFNGETIEFPYQCDPKDNAIKCQMWFNITEPEGSVKAEQSYYETECRCALDGDSGFCGQILGTEYYKEEVSKISSLLQQSNCHTNDRENFASLRDQCSIAKEEEWDAAVDARYKLNYWPYYNAAEDKKQCMEEMFKDSPTNMNKLKLSGADILTASISSVALALILSLNN